MRQQSIQFGILFIVIRERTIKTFISFLLLMKLKVSLTNQNKHIQIPQNIFDAKTQYYYDSFRRRCSRTL